MRSIGGRLDLREVLFGSSGERLILFKCTLFFYFLPASAVLYVFGTRFMCLSHTGFVFLLCKGIFLYVVYCII